MTSAVVVDRDLLSPFLTAARQEYRDCTPEAPPGCFAVLVGSLRDDVAEVERVEHAENVRAVDETAQAEFRASVVPCFGKAYANRRRGFWCSSRDLLRIHRRAEQEDLEVLGSIHLHPDWHQIGPAAERGLRISQRPTPMDRYMFAHTGYPVNMICYLETPDPAASTPGEITELLAAWAPPRLPEDPHCPELTVKYRGC
jgi:proteasome lid subunit RPN8/RPN11